MSRISSQRPSSPIERQTIAQQLAAEIPPTSVNCAEITNIANYITHAHRARTEYIIRHPQQNFIIAYHPALELSRHPQSARVEMLVVRESLKDEMFMAIIDAVVDICSELDVAITFSPKTLSRRERLLKTPPPTVTR